MNYKYIQNKNSMSSNNSATWLFHEEFEKTLTWDTGSFFSDLANEPENTEEHETVNCFQENVLESQ